MSDRDTDMDEALDAVHDGFMDFLMSGEDEDDE